MQQPDQHTHAPKKYSNNDLPLHIVNLQLYQLVRVYRSQRHMYPTHKREQTDRRERGYERQKNVRPPRARQIRVDILFPGRVRHKIPCPRSSGKVCTCVSRFPRPPKGRGEGEGTYFASTSCLPWPTCFATWSISTTEYGSIMRKRFCSRRVSYSAARCERMVGSEESSGGGVSAKVPGYSLRRRYARTCRERGRGQTHHLYSHAGPFQTLPGFDFDVRVQ